MFVSKSTMFIKNYLINNNILFETEKIFNNCRNPITNYPLRFDFYIPSKNILIEYDGEQHFKFGAILGKHKTTKEEFEKNKFRDEIKTKWAIDNHIKLIRINYKENIINILKKEII